MLPGLKSELEALRRRHSAALELMGERDEEVIFTLLNLLFKNNILGGCLFQGIKLYIGE